VFTHHPRGSTNTKIEFREYIAIWDTGATHSAITKKVADNLNLKPTGIAEVRYGDGKASTNTYLVNITLPNNVMVPHVRVTETQLIPDDNVSDDKQPQLLIGFADKRISYKKLFQIKFYFPQRLQPTYSICIFCVLASTFSRSSG
jgi:hypothetical protein